MTTGSVTLQNVAYNALSDPSNVLFQLISGRDAITHALRQLPSLCTVFSTQLDVLLGGLLQMLTALPAAFDSEQDPNSEDGANLVQSL